MIEDPLIVNRIGHPYFSTPERRQKLVAVARGWLGTPFHAHGRVKGAGVDCVHLWGEIMTEAGHLRNGYEFPGYYVDGGHHAGTSPLNEWLGSHQGFRELSFADRLEPGDLCTYRIGRQPWHLAGCLGFPVGLHVMEGGSVCEMHFDDSTFAKRLCSVFRPIVW